MNNDKYRSAFKRLETDAEFRGRTITHLGWAPTPIREGRGSELDDAAWAYARMQRRLVEDVSR